MQDITILGKNFAVLSYGRTGSNLLATNIAQSLGASTSYPHQESELVVNPTGKSVIHTHLILHPEQLRSYVRIFNLRINGVETIMSWALANHHNYYVNLTDSEQPNFPKINLEKMNVHNICVGYIKWHYHYAKQMTDKDYVVFYEDLVSRISQPNKIYSPTFPDKRELINNYEEIEEWLKNKYLTVFEKITEPFLQHNNGYDFVKFVDV